ncbi:MAG: hypothetical protein ACI3ZY_13265, partial [Parabacteroides sp.]
HNYMMGQSKACDVAIVKQNKSSSREHVRATCETQKTTLTARLYRANNYTTIDPYDEQTI